MLRTARRFVVPELAVSQQQVDIRSPSLRVGMQATRNVASDYMLLDRAVPFVHRLRRPELVVMLEGYGRFEENGKRAWLEPGNAALSEPSRMGTEAFAGDRCRWLILTWDPPSMGASHAGGARIERIGPRDLRRLREAAGLLAGPHAARAIVTIVDILRSWGLALAPVSAGELEADPVDGEEAAIQAAFDDRLSRLETSPGIQDLVATLGANERRLNRRITKMARRYEMPWAHWRGALHHTRILNALRLLSAPGATTELVARRTGFRSPVALCHAFAKGGLPSPGVIARAASRDVLDAWGTLPSVARRADTA